MKGLVEVILLDPSNLKAKSLGSEARLLSTKAKTAEGINRAFQRTTREIMANEKFRAKIEETVRATGELALTIECTLG